LGKRRKFEVDKRGRREDNIKTDCKERGGSGLDGTG
jgi:hypothetical protein